MAFFSPQTLLTAYGVEFSGGNDTVSQERVYVEADSPADNAAEAIRYGDHFFMDLRVLGYGIIQHPADSTQNPNNNLLQIPSYVASVEVRPDLRFD